MTGLVTGIVPPQQGSTQARGTYGRGGDRAGAIFTPGTGLVGLVFQRDQLRHGLATAPSWPP
jgi:hypothetical protein